MTTAGAELMVALKMRDDASKALQGARKNFDNFAKGARQAGAALSAVGAVGALAMKSFISSAQEQQIGIRQLDQALKNVGISYESVTGEIETAIEALQRKTNFGDEAQRDALRTLISIGGDYQASLEALPAVLDLAADRNMDLNAAALLVGKALSGETSSLSRYGILLEEGASQTEVMAAITKQFSGAAAAAANPLTQMKNRMGDVVQIIGTALLPFVEKAGTFIELMARELQNMNPTVLNTVAIIGGLVTAFALVAGPALLLIGFLPALIAGFTTLGPAIAIATGPIGLIVLAIVGLIAVGVLIWKNWDWIEQKAKQLWNFLVPTFEKGINFLIKLFNIFSLGYRKGLVLLLSVAKKVAGVFSDDLAAGIQTAMDAIDKGIPEVHLARAEIQEMGDAAEEAGQTAVVLASGIRDTNQAAGEATPTIKGMNDGLAANKDALKEAAAEVARVGKSWDDYRFKVSDAGKAAQIMEGDTTAALDAMAQAFQVTTPQFVAMLEGLNIAADDTRKIMETWPDVAVEAVLGMEDLGKTAGNVGNELRNMGLGEHGNQCSIWKSRCWMLPASWLIMMTSLLTTAEAVAALKVKLEEETIATEKRTPRLCKTTRRIGQESTIIRIQQ